MKAIRRLLCMLLLLSFAPACGPMDLGANGILQFADETRGPGFNIRFGINRDVAKGATLNILVSAPNITADQVRSDDPNIVSVVRTATVDVTGTDDPTPVETRITLLANAEGSTRIHVTLEDGRTDNIEVKVTAASSHTIEIYPWDDLIALDPSLWTEGFKLLPNTNLTVFGRTRGTDGKPLTGAKSTDWHVDTEGDAAISPAEDSDFAVYNSGLMPGENGLQFGDSGRVTLPTVAQSEVARMELIFPFGDGDAVRAGSTIILHTAFFSADGAYISGIGDKAVVYETTENASAGQPSIGDNNEALDWDNPSSQSPPTLIRAYKVGRAVSFIADTVGMHTITARWGGLETSLEIDVLPNSNMSTETPGPEETTVP